MSTRSFSSKDTIQLPRLSAAEAVVLSTELIVVADEQAKKASLPEPISRWRTRLVAARGALEAVLQPAAKEPEANTKSRRADRDLDRAWSATFDWLSGICKLPDSYNPNHAKAKSLFELLFPDALSFTRLRFKVQWQESKKRLDAVAEGQHDKTFALLGGTAFLTCIADAQAAYGKALGITAPPSEETPPEVRSHLDALLGTIRDYASRAAAHADPDEPGSEALSATLLAPLATWESAARKRERGEADEETSETKLAPETRNP